MVAARKGYRLTVVIPDNASEERDRAAAAVRRRDRVQRRRQGDERLDRGGARAGATTTATSCRSSTGTRRTRCAHYEGTARGDHRATSPRSRTSWPGMGTGGTLTGNGRRLHEHNPDVKVDRGRARAGRPGLRAALAGRGLHPADLRSRRRSTGSSWSTPRTRCARNRELTAKEGIFAGISSGAVVHVAQRIAQRARRGRHRVPAPRRRVEVPVDRGLGRATSRSPRRASRSRCGGSARDR